MFNQVLDSFSQFSIHDSRFTLGHRDHPIQRYLCKVLRLVINNDLVNDNAIDQIVHRPGEVLRSDAVHRRAHAEVWCEQVNFFVRKAILQAVDEIDLRADGPF